MYEIAMYLLSIQNTSGVEDDVYLGENGDINQYANNMKLFLTVMKYLQKDLK